MVKRSLELLEDLQNWSGERLIYKTGSIEAGTQKSPIVRHALHACRDWDIEHDLLSADELREHFPVLRPDDDMVAVYQPNSGFIRPEATISAQVAMAMRSGADIHALEPVKSWKQVTYGFTVATDRGIYECERIVFTAGVWTSRLLQRVVPMRPERGIMGWFEPRARRSAFMPGSTPVWVVDSPAGVYYGFPIHGAPGFKLGEMIKSGVPIDPDWRQLPKREDEDRLRKFMRQYFPDADGPVMALECAPFDYSTDDNFVLGPVTGVPGAFVAAGFCGQGFKYVPVVGEIIRDLVMGHDPGYDITPFHSARHEKGVLIR
jgi:sarcosine oxidase